jgi:hypothetical protein
MRGGREETDLLPVCEPRPTATEEDGAEIHTFDPAEGFESFLFNVHHVIEEAGGRVLYLRLPDRPGHHWYGDQMLANFFLLTCPYLYDLATLTYFPILRNRHSFYATSPITRHHAVVSRCASL